MNFKESSSGKIVKTPNGYEAFIPHPLPPPKFEWSHELVNSLSRADYVLGMLSREGAQLPNPHVLIRPFVTREAVLSSKIEGTQATLGEMLANEAGAHVERNSADLQEVHNYILALEYGIKRLKELPLSLRLLREIHEKLMQGVRGAHATPGEFRRSQNWIGLPGCTLNTAKYVPPTPEVLLDCLAEFEIFLHDRSLPVLVHVALCHYQFEAIHPFLDGNGRVGRLLISLLLRERQILPSPLLYLSAFFEATRETYYQQLYSVSSLGSWEEWLSYFLNGVALQAEDALSRAERINKLVDDWQDQTGLALVRQLAVNPYLTVNKMASKLGVSYTTVQRSVLKLENLKIISQISEGRRNRVYCATDILKILEEPAQISFF